MAKSHGAGDPHADREAKKYDNPIPSREFIIELLEQVGTPLSRNQLAKRLGLDDYDQQEALRRRLKAMERDGQLMRNRKQAYGLIEKMDLVRGRVQAHRDGYGFMIPDHGGDDYYLNNQQMRAVFDGDVVLCRGGGFDRRGKREAVIVEVLERNTREVVGRYGVEHGVAFVTPDSGKIPHDILLVDEPTGDEPSLSAELGQYVVVEIVEQPSKRSRPMGRITEVLGDHMAAGMEIDVAIRSHNIPHQWPEAVLDEVAAIGDEPCEEDKRSRIDLRQLPFVTIDGEDARDFDDAVYCEPKKSGGWRLWVAIADVSHYVSAGSALDQEAQVRGNSVYFPERVVPMLPEALSNGLCSLNPDVDRLCMVCEMTISGRGNISGYQFYEGVIHSAARLTYTKVAAMLEPDNPRGDELRQRYTDVLTPVQTLHDLYRTLRSARDERGAIDFETTETRIVFGADRKISEIVPVIRNDAHKLIEECMLAANVATARFLQKHKLDALYRVHEGPTEEKLTNLREFLGEQGLELRGGDKPTPNDYQQVLSRIASRPDAAVIQTMLLRSLRQAVYQPVNEGHFGLNYPAYTHFTSPIRRYPDLLIHRAIRYIVRNQPESKHVKTAEGAKPLAREAIYPYDMAALLALGEQCSMTERRADEATREVVAWLKCEYLEQHVGDVFEGVVSAVTSFGLFVELSDIYVEGLVHVSALDSDYYHFDQAKQRLIGERTRSSFHLGDSITVKVVRVSLDDKKIDLEVVKKPTRGGRRASKKALGHSPAKAKAEPSAVEHGAIKATEQSVVDDAASAKRLDKKALHKKPKAKKGADKKRLSRVKRDKLVKKKAAKKAKSGKVAAADKLLAKVRKRKAKK